MNKDDRMTNMQQAEALTVMRGRSTERGSSGSQNPSRSKSRSKKNLKCYNCDKKGHLKKDCWSLNNNFNPRGNIASTSNSGEVLCCEAAITYKGRMKFANVWLIDSGAMFHMTSRREWFQDYDPISEGSVYSYNDHALKIVGIGTIKLKLHDGIIRTIRDVRHVEGLKKNLLSLGELDDLDCKIIVEKGILKVSRGALILMKGEKIASKLYLLKGETLQEG
ncbi:hypothetical protein LIER_17928 [Lithospermum erythrorhizon]|uniref:CCHC-type domain-containing protein n=1 Tax=Lithospermum erythrorhizon TaxID=34254 RepID=A0AAV3QHP4_LITER